ncbi:MAG: flagellar M-ring protein FliF C-terminal domain-containing protein, partial [Pseudomonadota bacterium]
RQASRHLRLDANGAMLGATDEAAPTSGADDKAQVLRERVQRLLEARVGHGNAIVEVSVDTVTESEEIRERRFDPEARVAISTDTEERTSNSNEAGNGDVTVASNLPDGDGAAGDTASSQNSETRERINYEVSETERAVVRAAGGVKRVTVAVLVNQTVETGVDGAEVFAPRPQEELDALRELVSSAVGFDETRGDIITIKSMALQSIEPQGTQADSTLLDWLKLDVMSALQMAILGLVTVILGLFVVRPVLSRAPAPAQLALPEAASESAPVALAGSAATPGLGDVSVPGEMPDIELHDALPDLPAMNVDLGGGDGPSASADPVDRLRALIGERQEETVEILRSWLEEAEEPAS